ncbi:hypothetical protein DFH28DRAFT_981342 [Melampsora americana]|nr:hypothetical protein DFH28DRAFT_981342 [Melampsora americana]
MDEINPKDPVNPSHSHHSDDDSDGPITQASTRASSKRASAGKKPPARIRPNTKAKLAAALDNSADILKKESTEAINRERLKAKTIADHDLAKERILETSARLERESIVLKLRSAPSQVEAMKIFNASFMVHFTDMVAAAAAIKVFENEDKCQTFINSPDLLRWSWLAGELGFSVVEN